MFYFVPLMAHKVQGSDRPKDVKYVEGNREYCVRFRELRTVQMETGGVSRGGRSTTGYVSRVRPGEGGRDPV